MAETWLRLNRGPILFGQAVLAVLTLLCGLLACGWLGAADLPWLRGLSIAVGLLSVLLFAALVVRSIRPLLAYSDGALLVALRNGPEVRVPISLVEGFLLGRDELELKNGRRLETHALVVRIAEKSEEFAKVEIDRRLGRWCGGYITIRGTWTERLSVDLVNRLNARLADAHAANKTTVEAG